MSSRKFTSADGQLTVPYADITHVCLTPSIHALLQYLLLFDYDTITRHTAYFTGYAVSSDIASHLPGVWSPMKQTGLKPSAKRIIEKLLTRFTSSLRYPFLRTAALYAFDIGFVPALIGCRPYALLSDGPHGITENMQDDSAEYLRQQHRLHSLKGRIEQFVSGPVAVLGWGNNNQCRAYYMTEDNRTLVFRDKPVYVKSLLASWAEAQEESRQFVKTVFDVGKEDIQLLNSRPIMFCTQPLVHDGILSKEEYLAVLRSIFAKYGEDQLLLKLHPRDDFDYTHHFPQVTIYSKKVNMQLLVLLGTHVERVVTICSSSVEAFPDTVKVDWLGPEIHPKIFAYFGRMTPPYTPPPPLA